MNHLQNGLTEYFGLFHIIRFNGNVWSTCVNTTYSISLEDFIETNLPDDNILLYQFHPIDKYLKPRI